MKQDSEYMIAEVDHLEAPLKRSTPRRANGVKRFSWWLWVVLMAVGTVGFSVLTYLAPPAYQIQLGLIAGISILLLLFSLRGERFRRISRTREHFLWMRLRDLSQIFEVSLGVRSEEDVHRLADLGLQQTMLLMDGKLGLVALHGSNEETRYTALGFSDRNMDHRAWVSEAWSLLKDLKFHEPLFVYDIEKHDRYGEAELLLKAGFRSFVATKLGYNDQEFGLLIVGNSKPCDFRFGDDKAMEFSARQMSAIYRHGRQLDSVSDRIEELKLQNDELIYSNQLKSEFASVASHELKTPLTAIKGSVDALISNVRNGDYEDTEEFLLLIREEADRLIDMTGKILEISSLDYSNRVMERRSVTLRHVVESCAQALEVHLQEKDMNLDIRVSATLPKVFADPGMIRQALINLIGNAIKFSTSGQTVTVSARASEESVEVQVSDNGIGISADEQPHIFERFYQGSLTGDVHVQSTGLGLAIVKQIVEQHQGGITVQSISGQGSSFSFNLPIVRGSCGLEGSQLDLQPQGEIEEFLRLSLNWFTQAAKAESTLLFLTKEQGLVLFSPPEERRFIPRGEEVAGRVLASQRPYLGGDPNASGELSTGGASNSDCVAVPLRFRGKTVGVVVAMNDDADYHQEDMLLLDGIVARIGRVLEHAREQTDPGKALRRAMRAVRDLLQVGNKKTAARMDAGHLAWELATASGADDELSRDVRLATNFHDVAMAQIGADIENENRRLRPDEVEKLRQHPRMAARLLEDIQAMEEVSRIVLHHHEWFDGGGYPDELAGEDIPLGSRLLAIIDAYRSMTAPRKYKPMLEPPQAVRELVRFSGTQFDPRLVSFFVNLLREKGWIDAGCAEDLSGELLSDSRQLNRDLPIGGASVLDETVFPRADDPSPAGKDMLLERGAGRPSFPSEVPSGANPTPPRNVDGVDRDLHVREEDEASSSGPDISPKKYDSLASAMAIHADNKDEDT